jgi:NAD(P)-dependent dehydrogenase (short-subunit alcohol dehydrogenase family)
MPLALITGASRGLGAALGRALSEHGWDLVLDARDGAALAASAPPGAVLVPGDVTDPLHREQLRSAVAEHGSLDLLVNNASALGPLTELATYPLEALRQVLETDLVAPLALVQELLPLLTGGTVLNISSDAAAEAYPGWGGYGTAKAALDHASAVLAVEHPLLRVLSLDPGDMRTQMQQEAFPDEDISDRRLPETVVPALLRALELPSGRYRAADLLVTA